MTRGRYALTPSGDLLLGNARTAIMAWLYARASGGQIVLRIDDLDLDRCSEEYEFRQIDDLDLDRCSEEYEFRQIEDLAWLGLTWDGALVRQSERVETYRAAACQLVTAGLAYPCFCTPVEVRLAASAPHGTGPIYPGTCRHLDPTHAAERIAQGERHALRLAVPAGIERFDDFVHGNVAINVTETAGDLVLIRSDGVIGHQLACAIDDAQPDITHVVRGGDLLASAAFQRLLMRALDLQPPSYGHVPIMLGDDGTRLAKSHGSNTLREQRALGASPEDVIGMLAGMFMIGDGSPADIAALIPLAAGLTG